MNAHPWSAAAFVVLVASVSPAGEFTFRTQEIEKELSVGYAVSLADVDSDGKTDIVVVDTNRVLWYRNPDWERQALIENQTKKDNVCIAPYDIDGDGKLDFALGADWRPADTVGSGSIQWLGRHGPAGERWTVTPIGIEPTTHRMQFVDLYDDGRRELVVVPLFGRGSTPPHFAERPIRILSYEIPDRPATVPWKAKAISEELHVAHNFCPADLNRDGRTDLLVASFEGVSLLERRDEGSWSRTLIGEGNQQTSPNRGASEVKHGQLAGGQDYVATIEPWHGFQAVVYTRPDKARPKAGDSPLWDRQVIDEELAWGHAVWCANLDSDDDQELIVGGRDQKGSIQSGVRIYDPADGGAKWTRQLLDPGGVAVEDMAAADLDGDGQVDIVAAGRHTKNVRIYWNLGR